jgi:hydroxyacyl-ACP dehydratase HTD2-like protein with hotdog domain
MMWRIATAGRTVRTLRYYKKTSVNEFPPRSNFYHKGNVVQSPESPSTESSLYDQHSFTYEDVADRNNELKHTIDEALLKKQYGELALHPDLHLNRLKRARFTLQDHLVDEPLYLLKSAIHNILPRAPKRNTVTVSFFHLGFQQIYFRPKLSPTHLLEDGTDTRFIPGDPSIWKYRLWAGGSADYNMKRPLPVDRSSGINQIETISDIRVIGNDNPEKVFVTVKRAIMVKTSGSNQVFAALKDNDPFNLKKPIMSETYTLCFLRSPPSNLTDKPGIPPPKDALFSHSMTIDANLLFRFSALTYNAHKIHFDARYAREEYGLKNTVIHGPFTQILLTEFLRRALEMHCQVPREDLFVFIKSINYSNLKPLYVDEQMTICCKPLKLKDGQNPWEAASWRVWIETVQGDTATLAVKAEIVIGLYSTRELPMPVMNDRIKFKKIRS